MIIFSDHVLYQIKKRKIAKRLIIRAVQEPEEVEETFRGRLVRRWSVGDRILEVITVTEGTKVTIVTAYYVEE